MPGDMAKLRRNSIHVVIADSEPLARRVIRDVLQNGTGDGTGFVIPAEASSGREAVELSVHYRPEVTLMEATLSDMGGLAAVRRIQATAPEVRVLIFSRDDSEETQLEAIQAGASGFVSKNVPVGTLSRIVKSVADGEAAISRRLTMKLIERFRALPEHGTGLRPVRSPLTAREWEVLDLLCEGKSTREMAESLVLSEETIYSHSKNLLRKRKVNSGEEATVGEKEVCEPE